MKKLILLFLIGLMLLSAFTYTVFAQDEITVVVNGEKLVSDVPAQAVPVYDENGNYTGDRTMLPVRAICEKLNCDVAWNEETQGICVYAKGFMHIMWLEKNTSFTLDGTASLYDSYEMDIPPLTINDRTMVPVRALSEIIGAEVKWIEETNTVEITYEIGEPEENEGVAEYGKPYEAVMYQTYDIHCSLAKGTLGTVTGSIILEDNREMKFELYPDIAVNTCAQFIALAKDGFYDNTVFHRVIKDFVAQGGGYGTDGTYKQSPNVYGEFLANGILNLIPHKKGTLSLARADDPNSGSSQFFICHQDVPQLNGLYATFGKLTDGYDILDEICNVETDETDKPKKDIIIKTVIINE